MFQRNRKRFIFTALGVATAFFLLTLALLLVWLTYQPDSHATFYCTLGDQANCAIVQQAKTAHILLWDTLVTTGLLTLASACASIVFWVI